MPPNKPAGGGVFLGVFLADAGLDLPLKSNTLLAAHNSQRALCVDNRQPGPQKSVQQDKYCGRLRVFPLVHWKVPGIQ